MNPLVVSSIAYPVDDVHYVKKSGMTQPKVFKLKELTLPAGASASREAREFGLHDENALPGPAWVDMVVNGRASASAPSHLARPAE